MVFDGKRYAEEMKVSLRERIKRLEKEYGRVPCLSVLLVGDDYGSARYVASCEKNASMVGLSCRVIRMESHSTEEQVLAQLRALNDDKDVDGILIQLPLPKHISQAKVAATLRPDKDVEPCTAHSVMRILEAAGIEMDGKKAVVIGRSTIVGLPVAKLLLNANATVTVAHSHTRDLGSVLRQADIIVSAIGKPKYITADMVSEGAVVVDVGINIDPATGKMCGDVDFEHVAPKCSMITPVPGGVGPLTICCLMETTIESYLTNLKI